MSYDLKLLYESLLVEEMKKDIIKIVKISVGYKIYAEYFWSSSGVQFDYVLVEQ